MTKCSLSFLFVVAILIGCKTTTKVADSDLRIINGMECDDHPVIGSIVHATRLKIDGRLSEAIAFTGSAVLVCEQLVASNGHVVKAVIAENSEFHRHNIEKQLKDVAFEIESSGYYFVSALQKERTPIEVPVDLKTWVHPDGYDFGVLKLQKTIEGVDPSEFLVIVGDDRWAKDEKKDLAIVGYGKNEKGELGPKRCGSVNFFGLRSLKSKYEPTKELLACISSAGEAGQYPTSGDSGAPLMWNKPGQQKLWVSMHFEHNTKNEKFGASVPMHLVKEWLDQKKTELCGTK